MNMKKCEKKSFEKKMRLVLTIKYLTNNDRRKQILRTFKEESSLNKLYYYISQIMFSEKIRKNKKIMKKLITVLKFYFVKNKNFWFY